MPPNPPELPDDLAGGAGGQSLFKTLTFGVFGAAAAYWILSEARRTNWSLEAARQWTRKQMRGSKLLKGMTPMKSMKGLVVNGSSTSYEEVAAFVNVEAAEDIEDTGMPVLRTKPRKLSAAAYGDEADQLVAQTMKSMLVDPDGEVEEEVIEEDEGPYVSGGRMQAAELMD